jgi:hypothetical protein
MNPPDLTALFGRRLRARFRQRNLDLLTVRHSRSFPRKRESSAEMQI